MRGVGTDHRTVRMRYRLERHDIGTGAVENRKTIRARTELRIEHFVEVIGELIATIGRRIGVGFHDSRHDLRVGPRDIIGGEMWVRAG